MIDKNNKIISNILLTGNYLLIENYKFKNSIKSTFDINKHYTKTDKYITIKNKINTLLDGFIVDKKLRLYFSVLLALDLYALTDNKTSASIIAVKNLIDQHVKYNVKTRFKHFLMMLCMKSYTLRDIIRNDSDSEDYLMVLYNLCKFKNLNKGLVYD